MVSRFRVYWRKTRANASEQDAQTEMVAHLSAVRVVVTEEIGLHMFKWATDCQMVNAEVGSVSDSACGDEPKVWRQRTGQCGKDVLRLACARDALVEVAEQHSRHRTVGLEQWRKMLQVSQMVVPRLAVALAGADMSIAPRDTNADETNWAALCIRGASNEAS